MIIATIPLWQSRPPEKPVLYNACVVQNGRRCILCSISCPCIQVALGPTQRPLLPVGVNQVSSRNLRPKWTPDKKVIPKTRMNKSLHQEYSLMVKEGLHRHMEARFIYLLGKSSGVHITLCGGTKEDKHGWNCSLYSLQNPSNLESCSNTKLCLNPLGFFQFVSLLPQ